MSKRKKRRPTIANQLRKAIRNSPLNINAIAIESGVPQPVLYRFVNGERNITLRTAQKLVQYFDMELRKREM